MEPVAHPRPIWPFPAGLAASAFGLNWLWEMLQMPAYREMAGRSWVETLVPCTLAALGDVAVTFAVFGLGALAAGRPRWGESGGWDAYAAAIIGTLFAVVIELRSTASGLWSYTDRMPVVPVLAVGLWPVLHSRWVVVRPPARDSGPGERQRMSGIAIKTGKADRPREESDAG